MDLPPLIAAASAELGRVLATPHGISSTKLKTPAEARAMFERKGLSIQAWARQHHLPIGVVYGILNGSPQRRCLRGASHRAAVLLGIKDGDLPEAA